MSYNVLEELAKEYYEYIKEYFVRTNIRFDKRKEKGGYKGEIDILAYVPNERKLIHLECSMSADRNDAGFKKAEEKFPDNLDYKNLYPDNTLNIEKVEKIFILKQTKERNDVKMPEGKKPMNLGAFIREIYNSINTDIMNKIIPEAYPLVRTMQLAKWANSSKGNKK